MINKLKSLFNKKNEQNGEIDKKIIMKLLPFNPVILDCGSHIGTDSIEFIKINPNCLVHSVEPVKKIYEKLKENTKNYKQISTYNLALSDKNNEEIIHISSGNSDASSSLLKPKSHLIHHPDVYFNDIEVIQCYTLDTWAKNNNVKKIDLLWLDMQGMELKMLKASEDIISTVKVIHTEVSIIETYEKVELYSEVKEFLLKKGFKVYQEAVPKNWDMGNVLFVKN